MYHIRENDEIWSDECWQAYYKTETLKHCWEDYKLVQWQSKEITQ